MPHSLHFTLSISCILFRETHIKSFTIALSHLGSLLFDGQATEGTLASPPPSVMCFTQVNNISLNAAYNDRQIWSKYQLLTNVSTLNFLGRNKTFPPPLTIHGLSSLRDFQEM
jgi:hypothetical protein